MTAKYVLLIEDEPDIAEVIGHYLRREGYKLTVASTGAEGLRSARSDRPDLLLLDLILPDQDGMEVFRRFRMDPLLADIPVIMVTAKVEDQDVLVGLNMGAEDYVTKPFNPQVLVARVHKALRRQAPQAAAGERLVYGGLELIPGRHEALLDGQPLDLTPTEYGLMHRLASDPSRVFERENLMAWIRERGGLARQDKNIDVHILHLRRKLGAYGALIETVRGVGYRFGREAPASGSL